MFNIAALPAPSVDAGLSKYLVEIRKFPMLKPEQELAYARRWREHRDRDAAYHLVTSHLRLVAKIAMRYRGYGLPIAEIVSEGNIGLMQAVKRFDPTAASALPPMRCGGSGPPYRNTSCGPGRSSKSAASASQKKLSLPNSGGPKARSRRCRTATRIRSRSG